MIRQLLFVGAAAACFAVGYLATLRTPAPKSTPASVASGTEDVDVHHYFLQTEKEPVAEWTYEGATGPAHWGELNANYQIASTGRRQSPIDLTAETAVVESLPTLEFGYRPESIVELNNGHTIKHDSTGSGSVLRVGDREYQLAQFHMHVPSEHTIGGRHADMEIHFVHRAADGKVCVVAVFANASDDQDAQVPVYELPAKSGELVVAAAGQFNPVNYVPEDRAYYEYDGSFTTPPCTEGVRWLVLKNPIAIPPALVEQYDRILGHNNRPVQPDNDRRVLRTNAQ